MNEISLETILKNTIDNFAIKQETYYQDIDAITKAETDHYWKFALISLNILETLNECSFETNPNNCYISVKDEIQLNKLIQLTVCFGIHYNLENNVGISIEKLSKYGANITKKREEITPNERNKCLVTVLNALFKIKSNKREHVDIIHGRLYRKHLHDTLSALVQVAYSPNCYLVNSKPTLNEEEKSYHKNIIEWLNDLYEEIDGSNLVSSLLMAQSSSSRGTKRTADWYTIRIGSMLTYCLIRPNSVMNVVRAVLNEMDAVSNVTLESDWKKCDIVAQILCQCPRQVKIEDYVKLIAPQLLQLFFDYNQRFAKHFYRVAGSIYSMFSQRWPQLTKIYFTDEIMEPFLSESIKSKELLSNLDKLHLIYVSSIEPSWLTLSQIPVEIIHLVFQIYSLIKTRVMQHAKDTKIKCETLLKTFIRMMPNENKMNFFVDLLKCALVAGNDSCRNCTLQRQFTFDSFDEEEESDDLEVIKLKEVIDTDITIQMVENRCNILTELLKDMNESENQTQLILYLFDEIKTLMDEPTANSNIKSQNDSTLLDIENKFTTISKTINLKIVYFTQIAYLIESIDPQQIIDNHIKIIKFCYLILQKTIPIIAKNESDNEPDEMIHLILSIISVFTAGIIIEIKHEVKQELQCLLPLLNELKQLNPEAEMSKMADNLYISISTYSGVTFKTENKKVSASTRVLIEEIDNEVI